MGDRYLNIGERGKFVIQEYSTFTFCANYTTQGYCIWNKDTRDHYMQNGKISIFPTKEDAFMHAEKLEKETQDIEIDL